MSYIVKDRDIPCDCLECMFAKTYDRNEGNFALGCSLTKIIVEDWCEGERPPFCKLVDMKPTATWVKDNPRPKSTKWHCSNCGQPVYVELHARDNAQPCSYRYCPNCGAIMNKGTLPEVDE